MATVSAEEQGNLRRHWLACVNEISDFSLQRSTWLDPMNRNPHWSYIEFVCSYPDDEQLRFAKDHGFVRADEFEAFKVLRVALDSHKAPNDDDYDNAAILADPAWHDVVATARNVKQRLLSILGDPVERRYLLDDVASFG